MGGELKGKSGAAGLCVVSARERWRKKWWGEESNSWCCSKCVQRGKIIKCWVWRCVCVCVCVCARVVCVAGCVCERPTGGREDMRMPGGRCGCANVKRRAASGGTEARLIRP